MWGRRTFGGGMNMNQETLHYTVYESQTDRNTYVFLPNGKTLEDLPDEIKKELSPFEKFKGPRTADDRPLIAVSQSEMLSNLKGKGFHIQRVKPQE
jgi:uncharacterized protein YcgL (UPF0745 family)